VLNAVTSGTKKILRKAELQKGEKLGGNSHMLDTTVMVAEGHNLISTL